MIARCVNCSFSCRGISFTFAKWSFCRLLLQPCIKASQSKSLFAFLAIFWYRPAGIEMHVDCMDISHQWAISIVITSSYYFRILQYVSNWLCYAPRHWLPNVNTGYPSTHIRARSNAILTTGIHFVASSTKYACGVGQAWDSGIMQASLHGLLATLIKLPVYGHT